jgi:nucleotide-binding universal stress UspA family protein
MSWLRRNVSASTSLALAATSPVPVVVVPENWVQPPLCARPVVLGLPPTVNGPWGPDDPCARALEFALDRADDLRVPVLAVSVHPTGHPSWRTAEADQHQRGQLTRGLDQRLRWWAERYPNVEFEQRAAFADPVHALVEASDGAQLVVLCRGTRFGVPHMLLGQTARSMVRRSRIPVAVVPGANPADEVLGS